MGKTVFILIVAVAAFFGYLYYQQQQDATGVAHQQDRRDTPMVPYGTTTEKNKAVQRIDPEGPFEAERYIVAGRPTIIDFCTEDCPGCRLLHDDHYARFFKIRPDVAAFYIRLPADWDMYSVWEKYRVKVSFTPHVIIYGPDGQLIAEDKEGNNAGHTFLYKWMNDEIKKDEERSRG